LVCYLNCIIGIAVLIEYVTDRHYNSKQKSMKILAVDLRI